MYKKNIDIIDGEAMTRLHTMTFEDIAHRMANTFQMVKIEEEGLIALLQVADELADGKDDTVSLLISMFATCHYINFHIRQGGAFRLTMNGEDIVRIELERG